MFLQKSITLLGCLFGSLVTLAQAELKTIDFEVPNGDAVISASLHLPPEIDGKVPVVIVVPGSDRGTREYFLPYIPAINSVGYAVALYDKQGVGKSTGDFIQVSSMNSKQTIAERAKIVSSLIAYLKGLDTVDANKIGLLCSSQGTWVASEVYHTTGDVAFIMNYSGGVASVGASDFYDEQMDDEQLSIEDGNAKVGSFDGVKGYDPLDIVKEMEIPVLWVYGELDRSHPGLYDLSVLKELDKPNFRLELLKNVTHDLIDVTTNNISGEMIQISMEWMSSLK
ncbi:MAG: hypothetical protein R2819_15960 [Allomuricauda sp.]